ALLAELEDVYRDLHAHPELSMQEQRTAGIAAAWLKAHGYEVTEGVGGTGVVGLLRNGAGATVLLRADMDALPMEEHTGLPYASGSAPHKTVDPVVMAAATTLRLQTIVSREVAMNDAAVISIGALQAGSSPNVIPDRAVLRLDVRTFEAPVRERVLA